MSYIKETTICVYSKREDILKLVNDFNNNKGFNVFSCEDEADLIATPYVFAVVDINSLNADFFQYVEEVNSENDYEKYISYTEPDTELSKRYSKYFSVNTKMEIEFLVGLTQ